MDYEKFCSQILKIDSKIRFATVYDEWAVRVSGGMRAGLKNLLSEHAENELVNLSILDWKARKDMSKWLGKTKYTLGDMFVLAVSLFAVFSLYVIASLRLPSLSNSIRCSSLFTHLQYS